MSTIANAIARAIGAGVAVLIVGAGIWFGLLSVIRSATPEAITTTIIATTCAGLVGAGGVAVLIAMLWRERSGEARERRTWERENSQRAPVIDEDVATQLWAAWQAQQTLPAFRAPEPAQLPARTISVPVVRHGGQARPAGARKVEVSSTNTATGAELTVPLTALMKFASLPTPSRKEWSGKPELYGQCLSFFELHGVLVRTPNGGAKWLEEYPIDSRADWLDQFNQQAAHTHA